MSDFLNAVPKDLPKTDPLQFSFLMIVNAMKMNIKFNGKYDRGTIKDLPAFEYAVNNWSIVEENFGGEDYRFLQQTVLCALWKDQPASIDCDIKWEKFPNGTATDKTYAVDYIYRFEDWRNATFNELDQIISALETKRETSQGQKLIGDIFEWEILDGTINYVYAKDSTANKFFGVGATFTLRSPFWNCCPRLSDTALQLDYFTSLGFIFPEGL